jgi:hypothetical protein
MSGPAYPSVQTIREAMLMRAREFSRISGLSVADIGQLALNDTAFLYKVSQGRNFNLDTYRKLMAWLDRRWPSDSVPAPNGARRVSPPRPQKQRRRRRAAATLRKTGRA